MRLAIVAAGLLAGVGAACAANAPEQKLDAGTVVMENDCLKLSVSPVGARIVSLVDKLHNREEVKNLPNAGGMNVIRFGQALNLNEFKDVYELKLSKLPDGTQKLVGVARAKPTDERPGAALITKEYVLSPNSTCVGLALEMRNEGNEEVGLIPWVWHLLNRGTKEQPEEAHMTQYGAYNFRQLLPNPRGQKIAGADAHYFPAGNWTSRVVLPMEDGSNTLATVTRPEDMLKVYNWHRGLEDFATQELIAAPMFAQPGKSSRWDYFLVLAAPIRNIVYCSPELVVGLTPHPTWLPADARELTLDFSSTHDLANVTVHGKLVALGQDAAAREYDFTLASLSPKSATQQKIPVVLEDKRNYQLRLSFTRNGQPWFPGEAAADRSEVIIPLIVGKQDKAPVVFQDRTKRDDRLRHIQPQMRQASLAYAGDTFQAFAFPSAQRVFRQDTFQAAGSGPIRLYACAGEYESAQIVLTPKGKTEVVYQVAGTPLSGTPGGAIVCESVNDFIYVPTQMPSQYNALFRLGEYPEALLPTKEVTLKPEGNHPLFITYRVPREARPGTYRGAIVLSQATARHEIPVEMTVWNIQLPLRSKGMEFASSLKGDTNPFAKHADGTPLTRKEQLDGIVGMHLKYRLTPCDSGLAGILLRGDYPAFEKEMQRFVDAGATKVFLGNVQTLLKTYGPKRIQEVEHYLEQKNWTDYFYARPGFDEASSDLVPKIKAVCQEWKKLSRIKLMETYYNDDGQELYGWLDIWSRNLPVQPWMRERWAAGDTFWKVNAMPGTLEVEPWDQGRKRYVGLWDHHFTGSYTWSVKAWGGVKKWGEDYWCDGGVGNLSAVLMWPHETGILSTIRLEAMRDGLEDNAMLWMLREKVEAMKGRTLGDSAQAKALADARDLCNSGPLSDRIKSVEDLEQVRRNAANALSVLNAVQ